MGLKRLSPEILQESRDKQDGKYIIIPKFEGISEKLRLQMNHNVTITAETGAGKSTLLLNWIHGLSREYPCFYYNLEMAERIIYNRFVAIESNIDVNTIASWRNTDSDTQERIRAAEQRLCEEHQIMVSHDISDITDIINDIKQQESIRNNEPTFIFIDHLHLVRCKDSGGAYERTTEISRQIKDFYTSHNVTFINLCQQNREGKKDKSGKDRAPFLESLKESGSLENDSTHVCILFSNSETLGKDKIAFCCLKNREGEQIPTNQPKYINFIKEKQIMTEQIINTNTDVERINSIKGRKRKNTA